MSGNSLPTADSRSPFARHVAGWKDDVRTFFGDDWARLRSLIRELENESWAHDQRIGGGNEFGGHPDAGLSSRCPVLLGNSATDDEGDERPQSGMDRLTELSEKIDQQVEIANGCKD